MMPKTQHITLSSIESYNEMLKDLDIVSYQVSTGAYISNHSFISLPFMQLWKRSMSGATIHQGIISSDVVYIVIPNESIQIKVNGLTLTHQELYVIGKGEEQLSYFPSDFSSYVASIDRAFLNKYLGNNAIDEFLSNTMNIRCGKFEMCGLSSFKANIINLIQFSLTNYELLNDISIFDLQESIALALHSLIQPTLFAHSLTQLESSRFLIVKRVIDFVDSTPHLTPSIKNLIDVAFCSLRSLEYAFQTTFNLTPKKFILIRRLHLIRKELINHNGKSVQDIATRYGIVNLGRFSHDYFQLFGELPSKTLKFN